MARAAEADLPMDREALLASLRETDPSAVLASPWLIRRVVLYDRDLGGWPARVPHARLYAIARERLLAIAGRENLPLPDSLPEVPALPNHSNAAPALAPGGKFELTLLPDPGDDWLAARPRALVLNRFWAMLFHARLDAHFRRMFSATAGTADRSDVQRRIEAVGRSVFAEARFVLETERYLTATAGDAEAYGEFAAVFLELHHFAPARLAWIFPSVREIDRMRGILCRDVDADALLQQTRPAGAADPADAADGGWDLPSEDTADDIPALPRTARKRRKSDGRADAAARDALLRRSSAADARGNDVRAALVRMKAFRLGGNGAGAIHAAAREDLAQLVGRLQAALGFDNTAARDWRASLGPVLAAAASGWWNPAGRLLYDLQKVCVDHEREIYSVSLVEWALDWRRSGRRPLRRPLPRQRPVLVCKHLRSAAARVPAIRVSPTQRSRLGHLLSSAVHRAESRVRTELRPPVAAALDNAGLRPGCAVERTARAKLVEELLDELVHHGFLAMGNLRDAISRNGMKLDDLAGPAEFFRGDQLLRIDAQLAAALAGVYRRGEVYLRGFQRVSSLLFATAAGRILTMTVLIPFGGSFLVLAGLDHTVGVVVHKLTGIRMDLARLPNLLVLGLFLLGLVNSPAFRSAAGRIARGIARAMARVFVEWPRWLVTRPAVRAVLSSRPARIVLRFVLEPAVFTSIAWLLIPRGTSVAAREALLASVFVATAVLLNSRAGRLIEQAILHSIRIFWERLAAGLLADLFHLVMGFFADVLERFDRLLYAADEWLRFRGGQSRSALWTKAVLGTGWFFIAYGARFCINLLIEPQVNPVKHFPVVTVSHKIILPTEPLLASGFEVLGLAAGTAHAVALPIVFVIPGAFGFFAWELRENWKLYRANRPRMLQPVQVGSHGESLARLLRPGFHSGTVPKIFARLRRLARQADFAAASAGSSAAASKSPHFTDDDRAYRRDASLGRKAHKQLDALAHVREAIGRFVDRELLALFRHDPAWADLAPAVREVRLGATRIEVELVCRQRTAPLIEAPSADAPVNGRTSGGRTASPALPPGWPQGAAFLAIESPRSDDDPAWLVFDQRWGWILAGLERPGWTAHLSHALAKSLAVALAGLYRLAGADIVRDNVGPLFFPRAVHWDLRGPQLVIWPDDSYAVEAAYDLQPGPLLPQARHNAAADKGASSGTTDLQPLEGRQLLLPLDPVSWDEWVRAWEPPGGIDDRKRGFLPTLRALPVNAVPGHKEAALESDAMPAE